jgi:AcrR family transcriptional regulator
VPETVDSPRVRYRRQVRAEVLDHAWLQIATAGVSALSLKAIAAELGLTGPALYRYFASRDELLTELILTAYADLAQVAEACVDHRQTPVRQLEGLAVELRHWALARPQRYLLLYGTPVPGYRAPPEATALAGRIFAPVHAAVRALGDGQREQQGDAYLRSVTFWTRLHGVLSLELAGHFSGMDLDPEALYRNEIQSVITGR